MGKIMQQRDKLRKLILIAIFSALIVVMTWLPFTGYITAGVIEITTLHIVVILGAALLGPAGGTVLGLVWGLTCLWRAYVGPTAAVAQIYGFGNPLISVLPRMLVGLVAGLVFACLSKTRVNRSFALGLTAIAGSLTNTVLVLSGVAWHLQVMSDIPAMILQTVAGINGSLELVAAILIVPSVYFAVRPGGYVLGVDIGASATKLALVRGKRVLATRLKGEGETLEETIAAMRKHPVARVAVTGVGASYVEGDLAGLPTKRVDEFTSLYRGAARLAKHHNMLIMSVGTGTSFVRVTPLRAWHVGGTGLGGALLASLGKTLCGQENADELPELARSGNSANIDLLLADVCAGTIGNLVPDSTVANLAKLSAESAAADKARGICKLVFENIGVMAAFAVNKRFTRTIVVVGTLMENADIATAMLAEVGRLHRVRFIIPEKAGFSTAIGATMN